MSLDEYEAILKRERPVIVPRERPGQYYKVKTCMIGNVRINCRFKSCYLCELPHAEAVKLLKLYSLRLPDSQTKLALMYGILLKYHRFCSSSSGLISTGVNSLRTAGIDTDMDSMAYKFKVYNNNEARGVIHPSS